MRTVSLWKSIPINIVVILLAACNNNSATPAGVEPSMTTTVVAGPCSNPFFPITAGATWTYTNSGSPAGTIAFTETITQTRSDGFTLTTQSGDVIRTHEWACREDGLLALTFGGGAAAGIATQGMTGEFNTSNVSGITFPADIQPGKEWSYNMDINGTFDMPDGQNVPIEGTIATAMKAIGVEQVSVPAGTFEAMKIEAIPTINVSANYLGFPIPLTFTGNITIWLAPGIGWVKSTESGDFAGTTINTTTELQSFLIPSSQ